MTAESCQTDLSYSNAPQCLSRGHWPQAIVACCVGLRSFLATMDAVQVEDGLEEMLRLSLAPAPMQHSAKASQPSHLPSPAAHHPTLSQARTAFLLVSIQIEQHQLAGPAKQGPAEAATIIIRPAFQATNLTGLPVRLHLAGASIPLPAGIALTHGRAVHPTDRSEDATVGEPREAPQEAHATVQLPAKQPLPINALWTCHSHQAGACKPAGRSARDRDVLPAMGSQQTAALLPCVNVDVMVDGHWTPAEAEPRSTRRSSSQGAPSEGESKRQAHEHGSVSPDPQKLRFTAAGQGRAHGTAGPSTPQSPPGTQTMARAIACKPELNMSAHMGPGPRSSVLTTPQPAHIAGTSASLPLLQASNTRCLWLNIEAQPEADLPRRSVVCQTLTCATLTSGGGAHLVLYKDPQPPLVVCNEADVFVDVCMIPASAAPEGAPADTIHASEGSAHGLQPCPHETSAAQKRLFPTLTLKPGGSVRCSMDAWGHPQGRAEGGAPTAIQDVEEFLERVTGVMTAKPPEPPCLMLRHSEALAWQPALQLHPGRHPSSGFLVEVQHGGPTLYVNISSKPGALRNGTLVIPGPAASQPAVPQSLYRLECAALQLCFQDDERGRFGEGKLPLVRAPGQAAQSTLFCLGLMGLTADLCTRQADGTGLLCREIDVRLQLSGIQCDTNLPGITARSILWMEKGRRHSGIRTITALVQASQVWDPGQKPRLSLEGAWLRCLQLNCPPLGAAIHDELLDFALHVKEVFLERPAAARAQALPGTAHQSSDISCGESGCVRPCPGCCQVTRAFCMLLRREPLHCGLNRSHDLSGVEFRPCCRSTTCAHVLGLQLRLQHAAY